MPKVTEIKQNVKNKNKVSVFADGEFLYAADLAKGHPAAQIRDNALSKLSH